MSEAAPIEAIANAAKQVEDNQNIQTESPEGTWVYQNADKGATERMHLLMHASPESAPQQTTVVGGQEVRPVSTEASHWDDVFQREKLLQALKAMSNAKPHEIPAAAATVTIISLDMQMKTDAAKQGQRSVDESLQSLLRG